MTGIWPWLALAGLGAFHGLNPGMGWRFAVALGMHRNDGRVVWLSVAPIAFGHALSIAVVAAAFIWIGLLVDARALRIACGVALIGLAAWSFLMATAHGAGLMLWPALMPLCLGEASGAGHGSPMATAMLGVGLHTLAMLTVTAAIAVAVYEWIGVEMLRRTWINVDLIWMWALLGAGAWLLVGAFIAE